MSNKIYIYENFFTEREKTIFSCGNLSASLFIYDTGVKAVKIKNSKGSATILPYMGQMIWRADFNGKELAMKSIYDQPIQPKVAYGESYGCFLMHCGLTAMGNPTAEDTHAPHGELPFAKYQSVYIVSGKDENGEYVGISGVYTNKACYELNYDFSPMVKLYDNATYLDVEVKFTNNKDVPLEYYYLCHINHLPVDGSTLSYTADRSKIKVNHEVPDNYFNEKGAKATNDYLDKLDKDPSIMDKIGAEGQSYQPEIVFGIMSYKGDENGNAYTMQIYPDKTATFVMHKPEELPYGVRWISRTKDEDAIGMVLPATAEHFGKLYCQKNNQQRYLKQGETVTYHIKTGLLDKDQTEKMQTKIKKMGF